ncbi:MAG: phosphate ABC transporter permease PstA [Oscillospiraceae bacterium]|nr:phosphate ABC transporter permease PstA [Oscillospiraceae bacterium]
MNLNISEKIAKTVVWIASLGMFGVLTSIVAFILFKGLPAISWSFLTQMPEKMGREGGIASPIAGTFLVTVPAVLIAMPFGIGTAFYLAEYTKGGIITRAVRFSAESLAGIPSIVYGLFGFIFFVVKLNLGWSILSGSLTLAIMILPTIIRTSEVAISSVPKTYKEVSYSLGATKWQTIRLTVIPSAVRGIAIGVILAIGRCVSETAALILTAGSVLGMPDSLLSSGRTMAVHFYLLATEGISPERAFGTAALLIITVFFINVVANTLIERLFKRVGR